jgi:hypothetical protein
MSQIREYLEQGRAGKVYDPQKGLYMDPATGTAFVPTFTNIASSNIQQKVEKSMPGTPVQADPYLVGGGPGGPQQGGAMPGRGEQPKAPDISDPWAMANEHMKSKGFKTEIYKEMFNRDPQSGFRNEAERDRFFSGLKSTRNVLVDRFKYQIEARRKERASANKNARSRMGQKDFMEMEREYEERAMVEKNEDEVGWEQVHGNKTPREVSQERFEKRLASYESYKPDSGKTGMPGRSKDPVDVDKYTPETKDPDKPGDKRVEFRSLDQKTETPKVWAWASAKARKHSPNMNEAQIADATKLLLRNLTQKDVDEALGKSMEPERKADDTQEFSAMYDVAGGA